MRPLLVIMTLLGGAIFGCALAGRIHYLNSRTDFLAVIYPKEGAKIPKAQIENLPSWLEAQDMVQRQDSLTMLYLGGAAFLCGFSGLILERRRLASHCPSKTDPLARDQNEKS